MRPLALGIASLFAALFTSGLALAQMPSFPDAAATDPVKLGIMKGSPPPADKVVRFADGSAYKFPNTRWSFSNFRQLVPTSPVPRGA